jgi:hypothetical protein
MRGCSPRWRVRSISAAAARAPATAPSTTSSGVPANVITLRWCAGSLLTSSSVPPRDVNAAASRCTRSASRPSDTLGTHSSRIVMHSPSSAPTARARPGPRSRGPAVSPRVRPLDPSARHAPEAQRTGGRWGSGRRDPRRRSSSTCRPISASSRVARRRSTRARAPSSRRRASSSAGIGMRAVYRLRRRFRRERAVRAARRGVLPRGRGRRGWSPCGRGGAGRTGRRAARGRRGGPARCGRRATPRPRRRRRCA